MKEELKHIFSAHYGRTELVIADSGIDPLSVPNASRRQHQTRHAQTLLQSTGRNYELVYDENGKPFPKNGEEQLSISHSGSMVMNAFSPVPVGADLEIISGKASRVKHKFLGAPELAFALNDYSATLCWTIKEAVYKMLGRKPVIFARDMVIAAIDMEQQSGLVSLPEQHTQVRLGFVFINGSVASWTQA